MVRYALMVAVVGLAGWGPARMEEPRCLHGSSEVAAQAVRRRAALHFARQLNTTEAVARQQGQTYYALSDLPGLPSVPDGFNVQLSTDGASYAFSIKDRLDPCHFALFSDQDAIIYTATPIR